jgi:uncharacterized membrane protein YphA (DoxX/SURF4 family)
MKNPLKSETSVNLGLLLARVPMGIVFVVAGVMKLQGGVEQFVRSQIGNVPHWAPRAWGEGYLHALPFVEIAVGAMLILGLFGRLAGFVGALVVLSIIIGSTGVFATGYLFHANVIYMGLLLAVLLIGPGRLSLDGLMFRRGKSSQH